MIPNGEGYHYLGVKKLSALSKRITSKNNDDAYCFHRVYSFRTKRRLDSHKKVCENNSLWLLKTLKY